MSKALKYLAAALALLIILAIALPLIIPAETYKGQIIAAVERSTGRTLTINGDLDLQFRPGLEFSIKDATLSNAPGASDPLMAKMDAMTVGVDWRALFSRKISITKFVLNEPVISLELMKNGAANWEFSPIDQSAAQDEKDENTTSSENLDAISFGDLRIINGQVTWRNNLTGQVLEVSAVNLKVELPDLKGPVGIDGDLVYNDENFEIGMALGSLAAITSGVETTIGLDVASRLIKAKLDGTLIGGNDATKISAHAKVNVPSVRKLAAWSGTPIASENGFGPFAIEGDLSADGPIYSFTDATVTFDDMKARGEMEFKTAGTKPLISGNLSVDKIDLRPYMAATDDAVGDSGEKKDLKWDTSPIDFSGLKTLNIDFTLTSNAFYFQNYEIGKTDLTIEVLGNVLTANLNKMDLYKGTGTGSVKFNVTRPVAQVNAGFEFTGINAGPLVLAATDREIVEGTGEFSLAIKTAGKSQNEMMHKLSGNGALKLRDGKLKGVNLNRMLQIISAFTPQQQATEETATEGETQTAVETGAGKTTDFVEMGGTFTITKGVLQTRNFALINDALSLNGQGKIGIGKQTINMKLSPGQRADDGGTRIKMKVHGPWNDIRYTPDFEDVIKGGLRDILTGGKSGGTTGEGSDEETSDGGEVVNQLLDTIFGSKDD